MKIRLPLLRSWYYFQKGYSTYLSLPVGLFSIATTIYYLGITNIPVLHTIFPKFHNFLMIFPVIYPVSVVLGYLHFKKTTTFQQEQEILVASNPYSTTKVAPIVIPAWKLYKALALREGLTDVADEIDQILRRSKP